jgi:fluoroacetyl-CoA thioesterase
VKPTLKPGIATTKKIRVDESRVISFMGDDCRVYATPRIISDVEYTCREFLLAHLDPGEDSVGTKVNWEHVGPALLGADVTLEIKVIDVDGRRVTVEAKVSDGADAVAHGTHERFVVDVQKVRERLLKKAGKASG